MISKEDFNIALGDKIHSLSNEEVEKMRVKMDTLADILFDIWNVKVIKSDGEKTNPTTKNM